MNRVPAVLLFALASAAAGLSGAAEETPRLAVIWPEKAADLGVLIEADLSGREAFDVVDRSAIDAVLEQIELSAIGLTGDAQKKISVLGADGLLFVDAGKAPARSGPVDLAFRLVDTESGAIVASYSPPPGIALPADPPTAKQIVDHLAPAAGNLGNLDSLTPITLLNFRTSEGVATFRDRQVLGQISTLLSRRVGRIPGVVLLERGRMGDLAFEKLFAGEATERFWAGAYLLDGTLRIGGNDGGIVLDLRMTPPGGEAIRSEVLGNRADLAKLVDESADAVARTLGGADLALELQAGRNLESEIIALRREAEWAFSTGLYRQASAAAEASLVLGDSKDPEAALLLIEAQIGRCESLRYGQTHTLNSADILLATNSMLASLGNRPDLQQNGDRYFGLVSRAVEAATRVLFFHYRRGLHLESVYRSDLAEIRQSTRELFSKGQKIVDETSLSKRRWEPSFVNWDRTVMSAGGLWFDDPAEGLAFVRDRSVKDPNHVPLPARDNLVSNWHPWYRWIVPAGVNWNDRFDLKAALHQWLQFGQEWRTRADPVFQVKGWLIFHQLKIWHEKNYVNESLNRRQPSQVVEAMLRPALETKPDQIFDLLMQDPEKFSGNPDLHFYQLPFFRVAHELPRNESGDWADDRGRFFSDFCHELLGTTDSLQPYLTETLFYPRKPGGVTERVRTRGSPTGIRLPDFQKSIEAFDAYRKRLIEKDPQIGETHFWRESEYLSLERANAIPEHHPEAILTLKNPVHVGFPKGDFPKSFYFDKDVFYDPRLTHEAGYGFLHKKRVGKNADPIPDQIVVRRLDLLSREETVETFQLDSGFLDGARLSTIHPKAMSITPSSYLILIDLRPRDSGKDVGYLVDIDRESGESVWHRMSSLGVPKLVYTAGETAYFLQRQKPISRGFPSTLSGERNVLRIFAYHSKENHLREIANSARRPAETILDDRPEYTILHFGPGPQNQPMVIARFSSDGEKEVNTLIWSELEQDWEPAKTIKRWTRWWDGIGPDRGGGHFLSVSNFGNRWIQEKGEKASRPFLGFSHNAQFLRPPHRFWKLPISTPESRGVIAKGAPYWAVLPDTSLYFLLTRQLSDGRELPVLRGFHPKFGRAHYDLVIQLEDLPQIQQNKTGQGLPEKTPPDHHYGWSLTPWNGGLALQYRGYDQHNYYLIPKELIEERLSKLHEIRGQLSHFETLPESEWDHFDSLSDNFEFSRHDVESAILREDVDRIREFIEAGLPWDAQLGPHARAPIHLAAAHGKLESLKTLLENGGDIDQLRFGVSPLVIAIRGRQLDCIRYLLAEGAGTDTSIPNASSLPLPWEALETENDEIFGVVWQAIGTGNRKETLEKIAIKLRNLGLVGGMRQAEKLAGSADGKAP